MKREKSRAFRTFFSCCINPPFTVLYIPMQIYAASGSICACNQFTQEKRRAHTRRHVRLCGEGGMEANKSATSSRLVVDARESSRGTSYEVNKARNLVVTIRVLSPGSRSNSHGYGRDDGWKTRLRIRIADATQSTQHLSKMQIYGCSCFRRCAQAIIPTRRRELVHNFVVSSIPRGVAVSLARKIEARAPRAHDASSSLARACGRCASHCFIRPTSKY